LITSRTFGSCHSVIYSRPYRKASNYHFFLPDLLNSYTNKKGFTMALTSPGVEVTIIDESQYIPAATNSVPYILLATAQNKVSGAGVGVAAGTLAVNANKTYLITSQRDLSATFGVPFFYKTTAGTPINGYELNEYGLLAAYSALGVSNRCYVQRADIDLAELTATLVRPTGNPNNNTYWLDTANTQWGIFQWNQTTAAFTNQLPIVITDTADLEPSSTVPLQSIGNIGDYAVVTTSIYNPIYYKRGGPTASQTTSTELSDLYNTWVLVGSDEWKTAWATVQGANAPVSLTAGNSIAINDIPVAVPAGPNNTVAGLAGAINTAAITGVYAAVIGGKLSLFADSTATNDGSTEGTGVIAIDNVTGTPLATLGITTGQYAAPAYLSAYSYQAPRWRTTDTQPEPTGSVWIKTSNVNLGTNIVIKKFNSTLGTFVQQACPVYQSDSLALYGLDPSGGGQNIPAGSTYAHADSSSQGLAVATADFQIFERFSTGATVITGSTTSPGPFVSGNTFTLTYTTAGVPTSTQASVTLSGTTVADFLTAVSAAIPSGAPISVTVNSAGAIVFTHNQGGDIFYFPGNNGFVPLLSAGITPGTTRGVRYGNSTPTYAILANWVTSPTFTYTASATAPDQDPANGRLWYYSATDEADIMIQNNGQWRGYQTVTNDVRGDNLTLTNAAGPIFSATAPVTQTDESQSPLQYGDLWIDTSDLENYPVIYRWSLVNGNNEWVQIDNTDQTTENGILFADARWAPNGTTDPIADPIPPIATGSTPLITSSYLDLDAPDPTLYAQGTLLFNTRRSGFNVKSFQVDYFNSNTFPDDTLPTVTNAWVTASGNKTDGSPYMGRQAQRALIVQALKAGIDTNTTAREEQLVYNLISCPQYPELTINLVALNNERNNTAFVIADTPLRLTPNEVINFATNNNGLGLPAEDGLTTGSIYAGTFYPSCQTTDLSGSPVVQPPSHMMIRTIIRSDEVAYPWLAPAGTRRGVVDNATQIGYINAQSGEFESLGVNQGLRDVLYENRINPITFIPGVGITNFGNKTVTTLDSALNRINVARLVAFIRGRLDAIAKQYLFEPNDQITRNEITNVITSLMIDLVAKRGIYDYLVVCDLTNNTPARIDRNELYVDIAIEPVKAVEFIYIPVRIKNTGEIASQSV
jgi:hypothetical protein